MQEPVDALDHPVHVSRAYSVALTDPGIGKFIGPVCKKHSGLDRTEILLDLILIGRHGKPEIFLVLTDHPVQPRPVGIPDIEAGHIGRAADELEEADIGIVRSFPERGNDPGCTPGIDIEPGDQRAELGCPEMLADLQHHLRINEELQSGIHRPLHQAALAMFVNIKAPVHECRQFMAGACKS